MNYFTKVRQIEAYVQDVRTSSSNQVLANSREARDGLLNQSNKDGTKSLHYQQSGPLRDSGELAKG